MAGFVDIDWRPSPPKLRSFGVSMIIGFALIAAVFEWIVGSRTGALVCLGIGGGVGVLGLTGTVIALPLYWMWMSVAFVLGNIISRVIVTAFYYGMFLPFGLVIRLIGRDRLQLRGGQQSYWHDMPKTPERSRYERQF